MTRPRADHIKVFLTKEERAKIEQRANSANLSLSSFLRAAGLNHPVRSAVDIRTVTELSKIHGKLREIIINHQLQEEKELQDLQDMIHRVMGSGVRD